MPSLEEMMTGAPAAPQGLLGGGGAAIGYYPQLMRQAATARNGAMPVLEDWKIAYMRMTGNNPDAVGFTKEMWQALTTAPRHSSGGVRG